MSILGSSFEVDLTQEVSLNSVFKMASKFPKLQEIILKCGTEEQARIVPLYHEIVQLGMEYNLLYKRHMLPWTVGVHRRNREGTMISGQECMRLIDEIDRVGVAPDLYKDATCFEEPRTKINAQAFKVRAAGDSRIKEVDIDTIQASSVACSHWNQALTAAHAGLVRSRLIHGSS